MERPAKTEKRRSGPTQPRRAVVLSEPRRTHFFRAAVVGVLAGAVALAFQWTLFLFEDARMLLIHAVQPHPVWGLPLLMLASASLCAASGWLVGRFSREASGSGIPHVKAVLLHLRPLRWKALIPVKFVGGVLGIGAGLSLGREGPTVQVGAAIGQAVGGFLRVPKRSQAHLITCGAGAGLAAAFNAPLAGFIFVLEELRRELSPITYGTALIAAVTADFMTRTFHGQLPSFRVHGYPMPPLSAIPLVALVGLLAGLGGVLFNRSLLACLAWFDRRTRVPIWARVALVGALVGFVAWWLPEAVGGGHRTAERILRGEFAHPELLSFAVVLLATKFALTIVSYGSGAPGGIFAPLLVLGALLGLIVGQTASLVVPGVADTPAAFAVLGMAAFFAAVVRAPLTGIVLIVEMTANYEQMFALAVACLVAYMVAERMRDRPIYEALLLRDIRAREPSAAIDEQEPMLVSKVVEAGSRLDGCRLRDAQLPAGCLVITLRRAGQENVPNGMTRLEAGDEVIAAVSGDVAGVLAKLEHAMRCAEER